MNANMIIKWLNDPRYAPDPAAVEDLTANTPCFLPVEIVDRPRNVDYPLPKMGDTESPKKRASDTAIAPILVDQRQDSRGRWPLARINLIRLQN
jgi:transposase